MYKRQSIGHYLPFCFFFFFCLEWLGVGCWRSCCLDLDAFFSACSCRISCSCCFTEGLCSGSLGFIELGEELLLGEEGSDLSLIHI